MIKEKIFYDKFNELPKAYRRALEFTKIRNKRAAQKGNLKALSEKKPMYVDKETPTIIEQHATYSVHRPRVEEFVGDCPFFLMTNDLTLSGLDMDKNYNIRHPIERSFDVSRNVFRKEGVNTAKDDGIKVATMLPMISYNLAL